MQNHPQPYSKLLTIYGRKAVEEALMDKQLSIYKLHLADSNKPAAILKNCVRLAEQRGIAIEYHDKRRLSFISKNAKQDQGIALDIELDNLHTLDELQHTHAKHLLLLDNVTNPQNVGMIIRSVAAGFLDGLIIPEKGCAALGPLVIKASTGAMFKAQIYRCKTSMEAVNATQNSHQILGLSLDSHEDFFAETLQNPTVFVLGNEALGVSKEVANACDKNLIIPMNNGVESLNVAVTAALIAFHPALR